MHLKTRLKKIPGLVKLVRLGRILADPAYRSEWLLRRAKPANLFQPVSLTRFDRYPHIFSFVKDRLSGVAAPRLLSFGCSTGEEVFTLRKYFPHAEVVGMDINPRSIAVCRKRHARSGDPRIRFELASSAEAEPESYYDAIFCMAVLRHGDAGVSRPENCACLICFDDFEKTVHGLCRVLRPGGFLIIRHSNFRFADTTAAADFDVALAVAPKGQGEATPLYGRDNRLLADCVYHDTVFRKRGAS
jgi:SAM-dependent methyltransferase